MLLKNTIERYGLIAITLHWLMAFLMIWLIFLGLYMVSLPIGLAKLKWYGVHKEYGFLVLLLAVFRLGWRLSNNTPELSLPIWEKLAARCVHWIFYGFMFALPITGWLITSAANLPLSFFGLMVIPNPTAPNETLRILFQNMHHWLGYALLALIGLHTAAALKHHFIQHDDVLTRILP